MSRRRFVIVALGGVALTGCGFHLRGSAEIPFKSMYLNVNPSSGLGNELRRNLRAGSNVVLVDDPKQADALLDVLGEAREKSVLSINSAGRPREFTLRYRVRYRVHNGKGLEYIAPSDLLLTRDITFNDSALLAKESEEGLLYRDMQSDMVQQIVRRLALVKVPA